MCVTALWSLASPWSLLSTVTENFPKATVRTTSKLYRTSTEPFLLRRAARVFFVLLVVESTRHELSVKVAVRQTPSYALHAGRRKRVGAAGANSSGGTLFGARARYFGRSCLPRLALLRTRAPSSEMRLNLRHDVHCSPTCSQISGAWLSYLSA